MAEKCFSCEGCGQIANDDDATPWTFWAELKPPSNLAVQIGMVRPIECPACHGTGERAEPVIAEVAPNLGPAPQKFRKRPVVVEALQWDGTRPSIEEICRWANNTDDDPVVAYNYTGPSDVSDPTIDTLEGFMSIRPMDYVIRGVAGEFYPCKPDIFAATYDPADEADDLTSERDRLRDLAAALEAELALQKPVVDAALVLHDAWIDGNVRPLADARHAVNYSVRTYRAALAEAGEQG